MVHHNADDTLSGYVAINTQLDVIARAASVGPCAVRALIAQRFENWAPELPSLVFDNLSDPVLRPIYALPTTHSWATLPGATLVGDAAHLMSPFAGEGANLAMFDAAELAAQIVA